MGTAAWQPAPNPPRSAYSIHGHSGSTIAIPRSATAEWLFHQEKATLQGAGKGR